ncbi:circadian clock-controlled protein daywake [Manduca sexta]|uniref:circadian clock-controlled protein daywake n=1 Tax=Manduca sexta TaxID=7130 RepID=UPI00188E2BC8|nr:circadian clock-controlled protein daywake [Manduca sexta]
MLHFLLFVLGTLSNVVSMSLPEYINSCSRNDPNLNECALKSARESIHRFSLGDPSRGLPPLDPLYVEKMIVYVPNESGFKVVFKDNNFTGLSDLKMEDLRFDLDKKLIIAEALVNLDVENTYELSGKVFIVPITSNGDSSIKLKNTMLHIKFWYEHVEGPDGNIHWKIYKHDIKYDVGRAIFRLENLLNDKNLGDQINRILNEMWRQIVADVGPTICRSLSSAVVENLGVLLSQVSYDELMPE